MEDRSRRLLILVVLAPELKLVLRWRPDVVHGVLIPFFSLYFLNQRKAEILSVRPKPNYLGLVLLVACFVFYVLDVVQFKIAYFQLLTLIPMLAAVVLLLGGWQLLRYTWLPIVYLIFAFNLPDRLYKGITIPMRIFAAWIAAALLGLVQDLEATASGVVIDVIYKGRHLEPALDVAEACSGMRLLMAFALAWQWPTCITGLSGSGWCCLQALCRLRSYVTSCA